jgi:hypothetical protein
MIYKVQFETSIGLIDFIWKGGEYIEIYTSADEVPQIVNPFNYELGLMPFRRDLASFTDYCRWYIWEMERGVDIFTVKSGEISRISQSFQGNESPS